jgi:Ser/Thr protein kinase RdoA (MazF antagonist)
VRRLETTYSTLVWSEDGSQLTKSRPSGSSYTRSRFRNELRVNRLLTAHPPPVPTPALVAHNVQTRSLTFEALAGEPIGPKYPHDLTDTDIDAILAIERRLAPFNPRRRWLRRIESPRRLALARNIGLLDAPTAARLIDMARDRHRTLRFAHGDLTARNVLRDATKTALIDWEWAGYYPPGYDAAFLWFSLVDSEGGRARVEQSLIVDEQAFLLSALLVQLWHLQFYVPADFMKKHLATRDELIDRLRG